jgi:two-component system response regulator FixJ
MTSVTCADDPADAIRGGLSLTGGGPAVAIVDDDDVLLDSLRVLVESVGHRVRTYSSARAFLEDFDPRRPGCILIDERMPGMSGHKLHEELIRRGCTTPIIVCTGHAEVQMAVEAMKRGALTLIQKPFRDQDLLDSIEEALRIDEIQRAKSSRRRAVDVLLEKITPRQREVMELMVRGKPNKTIAAELGISERTVELHRARVLHAMGVESATELAYLVASQGVDDD